nr:uncharacterized protein LOC109743178 [Aegilops tauschii subsp. strangulata]
MVKDKTAALECAKKGAVKGKGKKTGMSGSSSRSGLPRGWVQGDWIQSTIELDDLRDLAESGLIEHGSWRLPGDETEPLPQEGECVLLATHVDRGSKSGTRKEESGGKSMDYLSDGGEEEEESEDSSSGEEVESPPCNERRSKNKHDPASIRGKATGQTGQTSKCPRTSSPAPTEKAPKQSKATPSKPRKALPKIKVVVPIASGAATSGTFVYRDEDEEMEDAVTSNPAPPNVIDLPDDDEDVPLRPMGRRSRKTSTGKAPQSTPVMEPHADCGGAVVSKLPNTWPKGAFVETMKVWQQEWFYITEPRGLDGEGGADQVSSAATRKPSHSSANEDAGPGALSGAREKAKMKIKEAKGGLRHKGTSDAMSGETKAPSSPEGDEDEGEEDVESDSPLKGRKKKTAASVDPEAEASKRGKISLPDGSDSDAEAIPEWRPSPARDLPQSSTSEGNSLAPEMVESETPPRASPPTTRDNTEVLSGRASPGRAKVGEANKTAPEAATAQAAEVSELKRKLELIDEDLVRINKRFDEAQGSAAEVETLKSALAQAKEQARVSQAAADKAAADLKAEQVTRRRYEERVNEVEQELKDAAGKCEA